MSNTPPLTFSLTRTFDRVSLFALTTFGGTILIGCGDTTFVISELKSLNEWPTFPQLIINGEFMGGLDVVKDMVESGEFQEVLASV